MSEVCRNCRFWMWPSDVPRPPIGSGHYMQCRRHAPNKLMDRLFGKRYRAGWPRGVRPLFPSIQKMRDHDPEWAEKYRTAPAGTALSEFYRRHSGWNG